MNKQTYRDSHYSWPGRKTEVIIPWAAVGIHFSDPGTGLHGNPVTHTVSENSYNSTQDCALFCIDSTSQLKVKINSASLSRALSLLLTSILEHRTRNRVRMEFPTSKLREKIYFFPNCRSVTWPYNVIFVQRIWVSSLYYFNIHISFHTEVLMCLSLGARRQRHAGLTFTEHLLSSGHSAWISTYIFLMGLRDVK